MDSGKWERLEIHSYSNEEKMTANDADGGSFVVQVNPSELKRAFGVQYNWDKYMGNMGKAKLMGHVQAETLAFDFTLDGTGVVPTEDIPAQTGPGSTPKGRDDDYVNNKLKELQRLTIEYIGKEHQVPYIGVNWWGEDRIFKGVLTSMDVTYQLFSPQGKPLRAKVSLQIEEHVPIDIQTKKDNTSSPDLTHSREVKEGDNLMILTRDIYGDPRYYREVARANGLLNFRKLRTGATLVFPPIEKQSP